MSRSEKVTILSYSKNSEETTFNPAVGEKEPSIVFGSSSDLVQEMNALLLKIGTHALIKLAYEVDTSIFTSELSTESVNPDVTYIFEDGSTYKQFEGLSLKKDYLSTTGTSYVNKYDATTLAHSKKISSVTFSYTHTLSAGDEPIGYDGVNKMRLGIYVQTDKDVSKVVYGDETLIDISSSLNSVEAQYLMKGKSAYDRQGRWINGLIDFSKVTATDNKVISGYKYLNSSGELSTGTYVPQETDFSKVTATNNKVLNGYKYYNSSGVLATGNYIPPEPVTAEKTIEIEGGGLDKIVEATASSEGLDGYSKITVRPKLVIPNFKKWEVLGGRATMDPDTGEITDASSNTAMSAGTYNIKTLIGRCKEPVSGEIRPYDYLMVVYENQKSTSPSFSVQLFNLWTLVDDNSGMAGMQPLTPKTDVRKGLVARVGSKNYVRTFYFSSFNYHATAGEPGDIYKVTPIGTENPKAMGWWEKKFMASNYTKTEDTTVDTGITLDDKYYSQYTTYVLEEPYTYESGTYYGPVLCSLSQDASGYGVYTQITPNKNEWVESGGVIPAGTYYQRFYDYDQDTASISILTSYQINSTTSSNNYCIPVLFLGCHSDAEGSELLKTILCN